MRAAGEGAPPRGADDAEDVASWAAGAAGDSLRVAAWTMVSRLTGVLRVAAIGAVLGPTLLGNTFQFTNSLPNLVYYGFLAGSLFSSLLVPVLVRLDAGDRRASEHIAGGFLGVALAALAVAVALAVLLGPFALRLGALGTQPGAVDAAQERVGRWLLLMVMPQALCYAVVGTATAVMNARRRFALAAAAPALENAGILAVLAVTAGVYGTSATLGDVPVGELVLLGAGATGAVVLHAAVQWWGARRAGVALRPRAGWRDAEVRGLLRRAVPALGVAGLAALQLLTVLVLANRVPGGVVAVQMGLTFYFFAVALGATPVALSLLPRLARSHRRGETVVFRDTLVDGVALALFVTVPATVGYLVLAAPLADVIAVGRMGSTTGTALVATTIAGLAPAVVGEAVFLLGTYASYAREDTRAPLRSMVVQVVTFLALASATLLVPGTAVPGALAVAFSAASLTGACHLAASMRAEVAGAGGAPPPRAPGGGGGGGPPRRLAPSLGRTGLAAAAMAAPVWVVAAVVPGWVGGRLGSSIAVVSAVVVGAGVFLSLQALWRAPELAWVVGGLGRHRGRPAVSGGGGG